ncbi:Pentatricopeptide repeat-containing protein At3g53360, mitochondrial [Olea europaea subsp. europaea]|uniref:Pentatricopeptide repeat-containing protein At3g53360, mitochondrial n=1 Tax=Olea europaea subsp. europaea TaxID=158383 RepID=A0A8S0Q5H4_OLEEU|nr:Pentatricopeptide repeat-containing protein At3g53360, mitochondrial [Olea europaea subsp. europaea]
MIIGYEQHGYGVKAMIVFHQMQKARFLPNGISYTGVLHSCSHCGFVEEGKQYFRSMDMEYGISPEPSCMAKDDVGENQYVVLTEVIVIVQSGAEIVICDQPILTKDFHDFDYQLQLQYQEVDELQINIEEEQRNLVEEMRTSIDENRTGVEYGTEGPEAMALD